MKVVLFLFFWATGSAYVLQQTPEKLLPNGGILGAPQCDLLWIYYQQTNSCYFSGDKLNFDSAEANCISLGGHLTSVHNAFENTFVTALTETGQKQSEDGMSWIGLQFVGNNWRWTDGSTNAYQDWINGDPKDINKKDCATLLQDDLKNGKNEKGQWHNVVCDTQMRKYICKKKANF